MGSRSVLCPEAGDLLGSDDLQAWMMIELNTLSARTTFRADSSECHRQCKDPLPGASKIEGLE